MIDYFKEALSLAFDRNQQCRCIGYRPVAVCAFRNLGTNELLVVQPAIRPDLWALPQEGIELQENTETASIRCADEELGVQTNKLNYRYSKWIGLVKFPKERAGERDLRFSVRGMVGKAYILSVINCADDVSIELNRAENTDYRWVNMNKLKQSFVGNSAEKLRVLSRCVEHLESEEKKMV